MMYGSSLRSSSSTMQPSVSISYGVPRLAATSVRQPPTIGASATPLADGEHVRVVGVLGHAAERLGLEGAVEAVLGDLGQLVLLAREAQEHRAVERGPVGVLGERQVQRRDVAVAAEDARVAERVPVDQRVQPGGAVAAREAAAPCRSPARSAPTAGRRRAARRCRPGSRARAAGWARTRGRSRAARSTRSPARSPSASAAGSTARRSRSSRRRAAQAASHRHPPRLPRAAAPT